MRRASRGLPAMDQRVRASCSSLPSIIEDNNLCTRIVMADDLESRSARLGLATGTPLAETASVAVTFARDCESVVAFLDREVGAVDATIGKDGPQIGTRRAIAAAFVANI